jgi:hypothetical protein
LELQQEVEIQPVAAPAHTPNQIVGAVAEVVAYVAATAFL